MKLNRIDRNIGLAICGSIALLSSVCYADFGDMASTITGSLADIASLIVGAAYVAGLGFGMASIFKFKQHRDNPTQVPVGTPFAMLVVAVLLVYLPSLLTQGGGTIFSSADSFGTSGSGASNIGS